MVVTSLFKRDAHFVVAAKIVFFLLIPQKNVVVLIRVRTVLAATCGDVAGVGVSGVV